MQMRWWLPLMLALLCLSGPARAVAWQDAVDTLAEERAQAASCVAVLKRYGTRSAQAQGEVTYERIKALYDGVIEGLIVALAHDETPDSLADLQAKLRQGFVERAAFCKRVERLLPKGSGEKNALAEIVEGIVGPVIKAVEDIYIHIKDADAIARGTIETQLEGTKWPEFAAVPPLS